jgi:hypothetical protein
MIAVILSIIAAACILAAVAIIRINLQSREWSRWED